MCVHVKDSDIVMANLEQKQSLGKLCLKPKQSQRSIGTQKEKKHAAPSLSFKSKAVREFFPSLKNTYSDDPEFKNKHCSWPLGAILYYHTTQLYYY